MSNWQIICQRKKDLGQLRFAAVAVYKFVEELRIRWLDEGNRGQNKCDAMLLLVSNGHRKHHQEAIVPERDRNLDFAGYFIAVQLPSNNAQHFSQGLLWLHCVFTMSWLIHTNIDALRLYCLSDAAPIHYAPPFPIHLIKLKANRELLKSGRRSHFSSHHLAAFLSIHFTRLENSFDFITN